MRRVGLIVYTCCFLFYTSGFSQDKAVEIERSGLIWQKLETSQMTWQEAYDYCQNLKLSNYSDWRLPGIEELNTIINFSQKDPAADTSLFPDTKSYLYWSSSKSGLDYMFCVDFSNGDIIPEHKEKKLYVRCVRKSFD